MFLSATTTTRAAALACLLANCLTANAANVPNNEQLLDVGAIAGTGAQSFTTGSGVTNISGAGIKLTSLYASPPANEQQSVTVSLWNSSLLSGGTTALATASGTGGAGWLNLFWSPVQVASNEMYYLKVETHTAGSSLYFAGGGMSYAFGDALEFNGGEWRYMSGGSAAHGQVHQGPNGDFTFTTYTDPTVVAAPVPEPETYAMMLAGLGVIGFIGKRRRKAI